MNTHTKRNLFLTTLTTLLSATVLLSVSGCSNLSKNSKKDIPVASGSCSTCNTTARNYRAGAGSHAVAQKRTTNTASAYSKAKTQTQATVYKSANATANSANNAGVTTQASSSYSTYNYSNNAVRNAAPQAGSNTSANTANNGAFTYDYGSSQSTTQNTPSSAYTSYTNQQSTPSSAYNSYAQQQSTPSSSSTQQLSQPDGKPSVQVIAASTYGAAEQMRQQMQSGGYSAVIVQIDGLYKVRIPYSNYEEAKGKLAEIHSISPGAFVVRS